MIALPKPTEALLSARHYFVVGLGVLVLFVGFGFGWVGLSSLSGAVIARGSVVVQTDAKKVQHQYGGVVAELRVRNGDSVKQGDVLVRLDDTVLHSNLAGLQKSLSELKLRRARLLAEREGQDRVVFQDEAADELVAEAAQNEMRLFELRAHMRSGRKQQIEERIKQLENEIWGYRIQGESTTAQVKFINQELEGTRQLWAQQLVPLSRVSALEREAARLEGVRGQLIASIAQTEGKIAEAQLSVLQIDRDLFGEVGLELREVDGKIAPIEEQLVAARDQVSRVLVTAPSAGTVHQLNAKTVGGVVTAGEVMMLIVPSDDPFVIEAQVNPADIDQVKLHASALVRLTALNQRTTPELVGLVEQISADAITDSRSGAPYYSIRIGLPPDQIARLPGVSIVPGMPAEVFIKTGDRRVFEMLLKPLSDQLKRAYRQD